MKIFVAGEYVFARNEYDVHGAVEARLVEEKFSRTGRILHVHANGQVIRTTPEHPFFEAFKGWVAADALATGDTIRTDGGWVTVEEVFDTGCYETVYNLRVAEFHTYFVGEGWEPDWKETPDWFNSLEFLCQDCFLRIYPDYVPAGHGPEYLSAQKSQIVF